MERNGISSSESKISFIGGTCRRASMTKACILELPRMRRQNDVLLDRFEDSVNKLKLDYDIFFNGGAERVPQSAHDALNLELKRLFSVQSYTYAQRFRLNSLAGRFTAYNSLWQKSLRAIEQGRKPGYTPTLNARERLDSDINITMSSVKDTSAIDKLLQAFCDAKELAGQSGAVDPLAFERLITSKMRDLQHEKSCEEVIFTVSIEGGKVHLKSKPKR
jgi:hypothetical protein